VNRRVLLWGMLLALACKGDLKTDPSPDPAAIALLQGNQQTGEVGTALPLLPAVLVTTESGDPAAGAVVVFAVTQGGGTATGTSFTTGPDGIATVGSWTLGTTSGSNTLTATAAGLAGSPLTFSATARPGPPVQAELLTPPPASVGSGMLFIPQPAVQLQDTYGNPDELAGSPVTVSLQGTGATLIGTITVITDVSGTARFTDLRLTGAIGDYTLSFNSPPLPPVTAPLHVAPGSAATVTKQAGDNQSAITGTAVSVNPAVLVQDAGGNPVAGIPITFAVGLGGGSIATPQSTTNAQGIASGGAWTLGPAAGQNTLTATAAGLSGTPATFSATGTVLLPGPPASIVKLSGDGQAVVAGEIAAESLMVQVRDTNGVGVPAITVTWTVLSGGGSVSPTSGVTDASGRASVEWTVGTIAGANSTRASAAGFNATFAASGSAGAPATLTRSSGNNQSAPAGASVAVNPAVLVQDANGNPVSGVTVGFSVTAGGGTIQTSSTLTTAQGLASGGAWTLGPTAGINNLTATVPGLAGSPAVFAATGTPTTGPPASITKISGDNQTGVVGTTLPESLVVKVADVGGTGIPGVTVGWTILSGGGSVSTASSVTNLAGLAAVQWAIGPVAAANSAEASAAGLSQTFTANGLAGAPSRLLISLQPGGGQSGVILAPQPRIQLVDASDNPAPQAGITVTTTIASGGGTLGGVTALATDGAGQAQFTDLSVLGLVGSRVLSFSASGLTAATSNSITITAGPADTLIRQAGDNQTAQVGTPVAVNPAAVVRDASGNAVSGVTVAFSISSGGGTIANASSVTNSLGRAFAGVWTLGPAAGPNTLTASSPGLGGSPAVYTATGTVVPPGPVAAILKADGDAQTAVAGSVAAESLLAQVVDANNAGVPGVAVTWTVLSGGGSVAFTSGTSDANGLATAAWTLGITVGPNTVSASAAGFTTTFSATGVAGPAATLSKQAGDNQSAPAGTAVAIDPAVRAADANGNPVSGVIVNFTVTGGNGSIAQGTVFTNGQGVATGGAWTLGPVAGSNTLRANSSGLAGSPLTFNATATAVSNAAVPLVDMGAGTYFGHTGGLYPNGNGIPAAHASAGAAKARNILPRGFNGSPNPNGRFVLLSIGLSNTTMEWCSSRFNTPCNPWSLMGQAESDPLVNHAEMVLVNGARAGQDAVTWDSPTDVNYDNVRDSLLTPHGLSEKQVEVIWLKVVNKDPVNSLPSTQADAIQLIGQYADILRALKVRYPNLEMVFLSSRIFAGYSSLPLSPEPYAYETGFAVKWVIEAQIDQMANGGAIVDPRAGNLNLNSVAPWIGWGPYLWADGLNPRSDGLTWATTDYEIDLTHPNVSGQTKVVGMLLNFFKTNPRAACWFVAGQSCP
jgi:hypothetical protein